MSTASTLAILQTVRSHLLTYVPSSGSTLAVLLGATTSGAGSDGKLYLDHAPDHITGFYGLMRLIDAPVEGWNGGRTMRGLIELHLFGRPASQLAAVNRMADVVAEAWRDYQCSEAGTARCIVARDIQTRTVIPFDLPADREVVLVRLLLPFLAVPQFLTA